MKYRESSIKGLLFISGRYTKTFPFELEQQFDNLQKNPPPGTALLPVISLGRHYQSFFTEWKREVNAYGGNRSISNTRYGRRLRIKKTPAGETEYVVSFYDLMQPILQYAIKQTTVILLGHAILYEY